MPNRRLLNSFASLSEDVVRMTWRLRGKTSRGNLVRGLRESGGMAKIHPKLRELIEEVEMALQKKVNPKLTMEGTGATYVVADLRYRPIAIFKPADEEAFTPYNPRGYIGKMGQCGFRSGVVSGEGTTREVAAYLLDVIYGSFSGVPATIQVEAIHPHFCYDPANPSRSRETGPAEGLVFRKKNQSTSSNLYWKTGSLQQFVEAKDTCADYDPKLYAIGDVHRIGKKNQSISSRTGILDIRLANMDRNDGNILVVKTDEIEFSSSKYDDLLNPPFSSGKPKYQKQAIMTMEGKPSK